MSDEALLGMSVYVDRELAPYRESAEPTAPASSGPTETTLRRYERFVDRQC